MRKQDLLVRLCTFTQLVYQAETDLLLLEALILGGRNVLCTSQSPDAKVLTVWSHDADVGPHIVHIEKWA
jgi:hypothetical protein